jgi:hypothetical protein
MQEPFMQQLIHVYALNSAAGVFEVLAGAPTYSGKNRLPRSLADALNHAIVHGAPAGIIGGT